MASRVRSYMPTRLQMNITRLVELFFEEERLCRICLDSEDDPTSETTRLISPCNCKGSAQYVHLGCLQTWQRLSVRKESSTNCDVCRQVYSYNKKIPTSQQYTRRLYAGGSIVASGVSYGVAWTGHIINKSGTWEWKRWFMNDPQWHTFTLLGLDWMDIVWGGTIIISTVGSVVLAISIARNPAAFRKMAKASFKNGVEIARNTPEYVRKTSKYVRKTPGYLRRASQHIREMLDIVYSMTGKARGYTKFMRTYHWILLLTVAYFIARGGHSLNAKEILQWKRLFMADPQRRVFTILGLDWMDLFWGGSLVGPCIGITRLALTRSKEALFKTRVGSILKNLVEAMSFLAKAAQRQPWFEPVVRSAILLHVGGFIAWSGHALDKRILSWKPLFMDNSRPRVLAIFGLDSMDVLTGGSLALPTVKLMSYMADVAMELFCKSQDEEAFRHLLDATVGFMCDVTRMAQNSTWCMTAFHWILHLQTVCCIAWSGRAFDKRVWSWKPLFMDDSWLRVLTMDWMDLALGALLVVPTVDLMSSAVDVCMDPVRRKQAQEGLKGHLKAGVEYTCVMAQSVPHSTWVQRISHMLLMLQAVCCIAWGGHALDKRIWSWKPLFMNDPRRRVLTIFGLDWMDLAWGGLLVTPSADVMLSSMKVCGKVKLGDQVGGIPRTIMETALGLVGFLVLLAVQLMM